MSSVIWRPFNVSEVDSGAWSVSGSTIPAILGQSVTTPTAPDGTNQVIAQFDPGSWADSGQLVMDMTGTTPASNPASATIWFYVHTASGGNSLTPVISDGLGSWSASATSVSSTGWKSAAFDLLGTFTTAAFSALQLILYASSNLGTGKITAAYVEFTVSSSSLGGSGGGMSLGGTIKGPTGALS